MLSTSTPMAHLTRSIHNILLEIEDHGKGISAEKLAEIKAQRTGVGITGMLSASDISRTKWIFYRMEPVRQS